MSGKWTNWSAGRGNQMGKGVLRKDYHIFGPCAGNKWKLFESRKVSATR